MTSRLPASVFQRTVLPVAGPLPVHTQQPAIEIHIPPAQPERFTDAQPRERQQREEFPVRVRVIEHQGQVVALENVHTARPPAWLFSGFELRHRVSQHPAAPHRETEHLAERQQREARRRPRHHGLVRCRPLRDHVDVGVDQMQRPDALRRTPTGRSMHCARPARIALASSAPMDHSDRGLDPATPTPRQKQSHPAYANTP